MSFGLTEPGQSPPALDATDEVPSMPLVDWTMTQLCAAKSFLRQKSPVFRAAHRIEPEHLSSVAGAGGDVSRDLNGTPPARDL